MTKQQKQLLLRILISAVLFVVAACLPLSGIFRALAFVLPYVIVGFPVLKKAFFSLLRGRVNDENFLMAVASVGAFVLGEYPEGVAVVLFYAVGELFESYAVGKSRNSVAELMSLCPDAATVFRDGEWVSCDPEEIRVGDLLRILPGEKVPVYGRITQGTSSLDLRSLTGESVPADVSSGDAVLSGSINLSSVLTVQAEKAFEESTAAKILSMVEDAAAHRSKSESFVASFSRWYTPLVLLSALTVALVPPLFVGNWGDWIYRALEFLVVSCPCALVISVPLTYFGGIGGASRKGILVKGSDRLEALAKVDTMVFDKTGTLTHGVFDVTHVDGAEPKKLLEIAAHCEEFSTHPIARSLREGYGKPLVEERLSEFQETPGFGISARLDGRLYFVGNEAWMQKQGHTPPKTTRAGTHVFVADESQPLGIITISDRIKENAASSVSSLRRRGIRSLFMLTGDGNAAAESVCQQVGLDGFWANLLPGDKVETLKKVASTSKGGVSFVGDGINDAPVLMSADVGIAMGGIGSDAAIEAADVVLMQDDLSALPKAVFLARKTHAIVLENIVFSIGIKVLIMVLCALGVATMWHAVFADVGVSVIAILNAMRTLSRK